MITRKKCHSNGACKNLSSEVSLRNLGVLCGSAVKTVVGHLYSGAAENAEIRKGNVNASKSRMDFFLKRREQNAKDGCLRGSLSGKGQTFLTALIPAPGGDQ